MASHGRSCIPNYWQALLCALSFEKRTPPLDRIGGAMFVLMFLQHIRFARRRLAQPNPSSPYGVSDAKPYIAPSQSAPQAVQARESWKQLWP